MATATAHKTEITVDQAREVSRQRRDLELAVADRRDDLASQQDCIDELSKQLRDPNAKTAETQIATEIKRLHAHASALEAAEKELAEFDNKFPSEAELERIEKETQLQATNALRAEKMQLFKTNRAAALGHLSDVLKLDVEVKALGLGGLQIAECSDTLVMMSRLCHNRPCEPSSAISIMREIVTKL